MATEKSLGHPALFAVSIKANHKAIADVPKGFDSRQIQNALICDMYFKRLPPVGVPGGLHPHLKGHILKFKHLLKACLNPVGIGRPSLL